jgi:solute carrier family 25 (peroxisomal adenine nucleotide transporter), member 17
MQVQPASKSTPDDDTTYYTSSLDAAQKIVKQEGLCGLYTGIFGGLVGVASTNFAYFYWYTFVRDAYKRRNKVDGPLSTVMELLLGAVAGALAQIFTIPVSVCTTRQQTQFGEDKKGLIATAKEVIGEDGITGLWRGLKPSLVLVVNPAITYGLFERFKDAMYPNSPRLSPGQSFCVGAVSKTVATIVTYPYIMAKVRMQFKPPKSDIEHESQDDSDIDRHDGAVQILRKVYNKTGFLGWYQVDLRLMSADEQGLSTQISKAVLTQAILFYFKEVFAQYTILLIALTRRIISKHKLK